MQSSRASDDTTKTDMAGRSVDHFRVSRSRTIALTVIGSAKMRSTLQNFAADPDLGLAGIKAIAQAAASRIADRATDSTILTSYT